MSFGGKTMKMKEKKEENVMVNEGRTKTKEDRGNKKRKW
jgi:hypothetical protein